jgi:hypothetical protein
MPVLNVTFVDDTSRRYQVRLSDVYEAPSRSDIAPWPLYETPNGGHSVHMAALRRTNDVMDIYSKLLTRHEDEIIDGIFHRKDEELCALVMMAWYLVDSSASLSSLYRKHDDYDDIWHDYSHTEIAVWAVVAFFRDMWDLKRHMSTDMFMTYTQAFVHLVDVLRRHGIDVFVVM